MTCAYRTRTGDFRGVEDCGWAFAVRIVSSPTSPTDLPDRSKRSWREHHGHVPPSRGHLFRGRCLAAAIAADNRQYVAGDVAGADGRSGPILGCVQSRFGFTHGTEPSQNLAAPPSDATPCVTSVKCKPIYETGTKGRHNSLTSLSNAARWAIVPAGAGRKRGAAPSTAQSAP